MICISLIMSLAQTHHGESVHVARISCLQVTYRNTRDSVAEWFGALVLQSGGPEFKASTLY